MYTPNEILFPAHVIPELNTMRGDTWRELVNRIANLPESSEEVVAFMLMMVRLNGCLDCETDSYRAMRGCGACTKQTLRRYKGSDEALNNAYERALADVRKFMEKTVPTAIPEPM